MPQLYIIARRQLHEPEDTDFPGELINALQARTENIIAFKDKNAALEYSKQHHNVAVQGIFMPPAFYRLMDVKDVSGENYQILNFKKRELMQDADILKAEYESINLAVKSRMKQSAISLMFNKLREGNITFGAAGIMHLGYYDQNQAFGDDHTLLDKHHPNERAPINSTIRPEFKLLCRYYNGDADEKQKAIADYFKNQYATDISEADAAKPKAHMDWIENKLTHEVSFAPNHQAFKEILGDTSVISQVIPDKKEQEILLKNLHQDIAKHLAHKNKLTTKVANFFSFGGKPKKTSDKDDKSINKKAEPEKTNELKDVIDTLTTKVAALNNLSDKRAHQFVAECKLEKGRKSSDEVSLCNLIDKLNTKFMELCNNRELNPELPLSRLFAQRPAENSFFHQLGLILQSLYADPALDKYIQNENKAYIKTMVNQLKTTEERAHLRQEP